MRIGILLTGDYSWAGGVYYSLNIIKLLQKISLVKNIKVVVFINNGTQQELLNEIALKNVEVINLDNKSFVYKLCCKIIGTMAGINYRFVKDINSLKLDVLYPLIQYEKGHKKLTCKVFYWLYDFQHKFLPALFSKEELARRDLNFQQAVDHAKDIVVSSHDSANHLRQFYPEYKAKLHVYNFVSLIPEMRTHLTLEVPENFLVVCNQFWPHKNHLTVLKAIALLVQKQKDIHIVFTGKHDFAPNAEYVEELREFIIKNDLGSHLTFTGFIAREEQVELIRRSKAVLQPSLFEGWSTVIEDAKALNKFLVVSDIPIHREQISSDVLFFKTDDAVKLSEYMDYIFQKEREITKSDYSQNIEKSGTYLEKMLGIN